MCRRISQIKLSPLDPFITTIDPNRFQSPLAVGGRLAPDSRKNLFTGQSLAPPSPIGSIRPCHFSLMEAVIFDLDGTILDTERMGMEILKEVLAKYGKVLDAEKEDERFGKMHKEAVVAIVKDYELPLTADEYSAAVMSLFQQRWPEAKALPGANRLIRHLHKHGVLLGLASNSIRRNLDIKISYQRGWKETFSVILAGDEVNQGKPSPDIFLEAAKRLGVDTAHCLVIEDSPVGVIAAKAAGAQVVAVPSLKSRVGYYSEANSVIQSLLEFQPELWGLPPFGDWVENALPIEPLHIRGLIDEGDPLDSRTFNVITDGNSYVSVPDQVSGVFIGWAKLEKLGIVKAVVSTGWEVFSTISKRVIKYHLFDQVHIYSTKEKVHLLLVGYIRKLHDEEDISKALHISREDELVAEVALDLPIFRNIDHFLAEVDFGEENGLVNLIVDGHSR